MVLVFVLGIALPVAKLVELVPQYASSSRALQADLERRLVNRAPTSLLAAA